VGESKWWVSAALVSVLAVAVSCERPQSGGTRYKPQKKERGGMAFVVKQNGKCMVLGGPKNHVAQPDEKVTWIVINGCDQKVTVELTANQSTTSGAPASAFKQGNGPHAVKDLDPGQTKKLTLEVLDQGFPANTESVYTYSILIQGDPTSGIDPELDIWP
jgi:hypothetical protein